jgi:hypothetical protein
VLRLLETGKGFDYWESGMDVGFGEDFYDSFVAYQSKLLKEFDRMTSEYGFKVIRSSRTIARVSADLRRAITAVINAPSDAAGLTEPMSLAPRNGMSDGSGTLVARNQKKKQVVE